MKNKTSLTKSQKLAVILSFLYEVIICLIVSDEHKAIQPFIIFSLPCLLYWAGVWIYGFGYISKIVKQPLKSFSKKSTIKKRLILIGMYELVVAIIPLFYSRSFKEYFVAFITFSFLSVLYCFLIFYFNRVKYITKQKYLFRFLNVLALFFPFIRGITKNVDFYSISSRIGEGIGFCMGGYMLYFCLASIVTFFIKDKERKQKTSIMLVFLLSLLFFIIDIQSKKIEKHNNEMKNDLIVSMTSITEEEFIKYITNSGLEDIVTTQNMDLMKTQKGLKQLYTRGKNIIKKIDNLDISSDISIISSNIIRKMENKCFTKYSKTNCDDFIKGFSNSINNDKIKLTEFIENKRRMIHAEFLVVECAYKKSGRCDEFINTYTKERTNLQNLYYKLMNGMSFQLKIMD